MADGGVNMRSKVPKATGEVLKPAQLVPGLLALSWRIPSIVKTMRRILGFQNETPLSVGTILERNAEKYAKKTALLYEDIRITHEAFNKRINQYAHYFSAQGVRKGDVALVLVDNRPELLMFLGALSKLGAVASLINPNQRGEVLLYSINLTRGRHFIVGEELLEAFEEIRGGLGLTADDRLYYQPEPGGPGAPDGYDNLEEVIREQPTSNPSSTGEIKLGDPFAYVFTSGTTGLPKASIQTHRRWFNGMYWFGRIVMNLKPTDTHYCPLPFCHTNGLHVAWGSVAGCGATLAMRRRLSASQFWSDTRKFEANSFIYVGEVCRYLMNQPERPDDRDNPIEAIVGNGLRPDIWKAFKKRFGISKVFELYGAAEAPLIFSNLLNVDCTVGMCLTPFAIVEYDTDADEPVRGGEGYMQKVPPGETGLLLAEISERMPFVGYTEKEETEKKIFRDVFEKGDLWFNCGDLVFNQGYRHIQFVDRLGDTFRWKGENVSTSEVEKVVNTLTQVAESTAYGVVIPGTDGRAGMVAVIPATGVEAFDLKALAETVREALPSYAVPKFVRFKEAFETTGTHKIKKKVLRDEGFDPNVVEDPLFVLLPEGDAYQPLTKELHQEILTGRHRF
ncbi:MAG: long-chain-acyl-CoA synthetase [Thermodesulfobacteriota bacterium]